MCPGFEIDLLNAVETFKTVAEMLFPNITEENDNGEWEHELEEFDDMISAGIIDPTKVTRSALQNAASIAATVLTTEAVVADIKEEAPAAAAGAGGMGGMY